MQGFFDVLAVPKGEWLLNNAASSVLGRMVTKLAQKKGVKTIGIVRRRELEQELTDLGADAVLVVGEDDIPTKVREITNGKGAYAALEPVAGEGTADIMASVRDGGVLLLYGAMADFKFVGNVPDILFRDVKIHGFWLNVWLSSIGDRRQEILKETMEFMLDGTLSPYTGEKYPLEQVKEAIREAGRPGRGGKVLLEG